MDTVLTGGCACRAIRYETQAPPKFTVICQCRQCQRVSGSGHAAQFGVATESTAIDGDLTYYDMPADSGNTTTSGFCGTCGSPVLKKTSGYPQFVFFHAATLDDPSVYKPEMVVYSAFQQPWDHVDPALPRR